MKAERSIHRQQLEDGSWRIVEVSKNTGAVLRVIVSDLSNEDEANGAYSYSIKKAAQ